MNDDVERVLNQVSARPAGAELRERVLGAVAQELAPRSGSRWEARAALAVAASILLAGALNVWTVKASNSRRARLYGAAPVPKHVVEICQAVQSVTDAETARRMQQDLVAVWRSRPAQPLRNVCSSHGIRGLLDVTGKGWRDENVPESPKTDRDRGRRLDRDTSDSRRSMGPEVCCTA